MKTIRIAEYIRQYASTSRRDSAYKRKLRNTAKKIEEFEAFLGKDVYTSDFDDRMMEEFDYFLRSDPKSYLRGTIKSFGAKIGEFLRKSGKDGYAVDMRHTDYSFPNAEIYNVALSEEEVTAIYNLKNLSKEQKVARFWFIFNCWTAFRFSDLKRITDINISADTLKIRTQKTGVIVEMPLHWMVKALLEEVDYKLPELKTQQNYGAILKRLCRRAKINEKILIERHEGNRFVRKTIPKWQKVSAHTARRSFATNSYLAGIPTARIMLLTGHKTEAAFFKYICIDKSQNAKILSNHDFFSDTIKTLTFAQTKSMKNEAKRKKVANVLQTARVQRGLSLEEVANHVGCKPQTLQRIEAGIFSPTSEILYAIAEAIGIEIKIDETVI